MRKALNPPIGNSEPDLLLLEGELKMLQAENRWLQKVNQRLLEENQRLHLKLDQRARDGVSLPEPSKSLDNLQTALEKERRIHELVGARGLRRDGPRG